jgi:hypothetical protein
MDQIERYLDQVCRGIAGPRALRQHIRRELAEHLRDAAAVHQTAGMCPDDALARALEDFGGPEQVRAELEATHGHRMMTVVVDKALQWKEMTMKARWVWTTWAHAALLLALTLGLSFFYGCLVFFVPKFKELGRDGWFDATGTGGETRYVLEWCTHTLSGLLSIGSWDVWIALVLVAVWVLFEWRVRSENKTFMRLAGLGTLTVGIYVAAFLMALVLILPPLIFMPPSYHAPRAREIAHQQLVKLDATLQTIDSSTPDRNWMNTWQQVDTIQHAIRMADSAGGNYVWGSDADVARWNSYMQTVEVALHEARDACRIQNSEKFTAAMQSFRQTYAQMRAAPVQR